ncbi:MAG: hypothetical protein IME93_07160 [Proteobacteria bacterium]|nr:hypothetical protein [Pseudomonadota bacterium]
MKYSNQIARRQWLGVMLLMCVSLSSHALGVAPNTLVSNTASISYSVGGVGQTAIESSPTGNSTGGVGLGTATTFYVDTKVDVSVAVQDAALVQVAAGATASVTTYRVYNNSNATFDFSLTATDLDTGATWANSGQLDTTPTATEALTSVTAYWDVNGNGIYEVGTDTITHINSLAVDDGSLATYATVFVVASVPAGYADGEIAMVSLAALARTDDGAATLGGALTETAGAGTLDNTGGTVADVVFADAATTYDVTARDATDTDRSGYIVTSAQISIQKTVANYWWHVDGLGNATVANPQSIPGAYVRYTIVVSNNAAATGSAVLGTIADTLAATNLAIDPDLIASGTGAATSAPGSGFSVTYTTATARTGAGAATYYTTTSSADGLDHDGSATGGAITATMSTLLPADAGNGYVVGELKPGDDVTIIFNAIVQ